MKIVADKFSLKSFIWFFIESSLIKKEIQHYTDEYSFSA